MDEYKRLSTINQDKQQALDEIKNICTALDKAEDALREKISLRKNELMSLKKDYSNMIETYTHIIRASVKK